MIENMEAELTEESEINSKTYNLAVTEEADLDESRPGYLKKERKIKSYKKTMNIDIETLTHSKRETN